MVLNLGSFPGMFWNLSSLSVWIKIILAKIDMHIDHNHFNFNVNSFLSVPIIVSIDSMIWNCNLMYIFKIPYRGYIFRPYSDHFVQLNMPHAKCQKLGWFGNVSAVEISFAMISSWNGRNHGDQWHCIYLYLVYGKSDAELKLIQLIFPQISSPWMKLHMIPNEHDLTNKKSVMMACWHCFLFILSVWKYACMCVHTVTP